MTAPDTTDPLPTLARAAQPQLRAGVAPQRPADGSPDAGPAQAVTDDAGASAHTAAIDPMTLDPLSESPAQAGRELRGRGLRLWRLRRQGPTPTPPTATATATVTAAATTAATEDGVLRSGRLAGKGMNAAIWALSWPVLCESVLNSTNGLVDSMLASGVSQAAADAVTPGAYLTWFIGLISMAIGVGATALIARSIGAGRWAVARAALGQAMLLAVLGGALAAVFLALMAVPLGAVMGLSGRTAELMHHYLWAYALGVPFSTVLFAANACARGAGDTRRPLWVMATVNVVNVIASIALGSWAGLGVLGIGLGTSVAHVVGAALIVGSHARGASGIGLTRRWLRPHRVTAVRLLRLGLPNFFETLGMWAANMLVLLMVGWMNAAETARLLALEAGRPLPGEAPIDQASGGLLGAHLNAIRIEAYSFLPGFAMGIAAGALCGQYLGAGMPQTARRAILRCAAMAVSMMGLMGLLFVFLGRAITGLVSQQPAHLEHTPRLLMITGMVQMPFAVALVMRSALHGAGDVRAVMVLTWISQWGLRLPLAYLLSGVDIPVPGWLGGAPGRVIANPSPLDWGVTGLWVGLCCEIVIRAALYTARFLQGAWVRARV